MLEYDSEIGKWIDDNGDEWESEEDYFDSLQLDDSYHFSIPFNYIKSHDIDGDEVMATTNMEVDVIWNSSDHQYSVSYSVPDMYLIDPDEGNSDEEEFYEYQVRDKLMDKLESLGVDTVMIVEQY